jgi:predicted aspartyl protease
MSIFLRGIITDDRLPLVSDFHVVGDEHDTPVQIILDTGFSGMVVLPRLMQTLGRFTPSGYASFELADGTIVHEELFSGTVRTGRRRLEVVVSFTDSRIGLIGMALIEGKRASFNLKSRTFKVYD